MELMILMFVRGWSSTIEIILMICLIILIIELMILMLVRGVEFDNCPRRSISRFLVEQFQSQKESVNPQGPTALEKLHFKQE